MRKLGLVFGVTFILLAQIGCDNESARNRNAQIVANYDKAINNNGENLNVNTNVNINENVNVNAEAEEVSEFTDASDGLKKGNDYLESNNTNNAVDAFKQAVELDPDMAEAHFKLGVAYALVESEEEATDTNVKTEVETKKKKPKKKNSEKAFENSVKAYKKFVRKNPKSHEGFYNLGRAYNKLFDDKEAERALQKAVALNGENSVYRTELGAVLIKLARYPSAIKQLNKAIELDEDNFRAEDLLVKAKAGRKRTGFKSKKKDKT